MVSLLITFLLTFFFSTIFIIFFFFFFLKSKLYCTCDVCHSYLTSNWSTQYNNLCDWYTHLLQNSPSQTIHIHVLSNTITANPSNVQHILKTNFLNYPKGKQFSMILGDLLGNGIFNVDGDAWMFQRKMAKLELGNVSSSFDNVKFHVESRLLPLLSSVASGKDGGLVDLQSVFRRFSLEYICRFSFSLDVNSLELPFLVSKLSDSFDLATTLSAKRAVSTSPVVWKLNRRLNLGSERKLKDAIRNVNIFVEKVIENKTKLGFTENRKDLLSRFMEVSDDRSFLRDVIVNFILAGRDTVSSALTSFFWLIMKHPEAESHIRTEFGHHRKQEFVTFEELKELHYLQAAIHESMRLYPPIQFDSKFAVKNDELPDGTRVKKGTKVTFHPYAMGRMESIWGEDCNEFKPERWLMKNGGFKQENPFKYPVFQAGFRVCLGKEMALMEMKTVVFGILSRFEVRLVKSDGELRFEPGLTATVKNGVPVIVGERSVVAS